MTDWEECILGKLAENLGRYVKRDLILVYQKKQGKAVLLKKFINIKETGTFRDSKKNWCIHS